MRIASLQKVPFQRGLKKLDSSKWRWRVQLNSTCITFSLAADQERHAVRRTVPNRQFIAYRPQTSPLISYSLLLPPMVEFLQRFSRGRGSCPNYPSAKLPAFRVDFFACYIDIDSWTCSALGLMFYCFATNAGFFWFRSRKGTFQKWEILCLLHIMNPSTLVKSSIKKHYYIYWNIIN